MSGGKLKTKERVLNGWLYDENATKGILGWTFKIKNDGIYMDLVRAECGVMRQ